MRKIEILFILLSLSIASAAYSKESTKYKVKQSNINDIYVEASVGNIFFSSKYGAGIGYFITENTAIEAEYYVLGGLFNTNFSRTTSLDIKRFFGKSFYIETGLSYNQNTQRDNFNERSVGKDRPSTDITTPPPPAMQFMTETIFHREYETINVDFAFGNRFHFKSGAYVGYEWAGISTPIYHIGTLKHSTKELSEEKMNTLREREKGKEVNPNLVHFLNLNIGWKFN